MLESFPQSDASVLEVRAWIMEILKARGLDDLGPLREIHHEIKQIPWTGSEFARLDQKQVKAPISDMLYSFPTSAKYVANDIWELVEVSFLLFLMSSISPTFTGAFASSFCPVSFHLN